MEKLKVCRASIHLWMRTGSESMFFLKKETIGLLSVLSLKHIPSKNPRKRWHANKSAKNSFSIWEYRLSTLVSFLEANIIGLPFCRSTQPRPTPDASHLTTVSSQNGLKNFNGFIFCTSFCTNSNAIWCLRSQSKFSDVCNSYRSFVKCEKLGINLWAVYSANPKNERKLLCEFGTLNLASESILEGSGNRPDSERVCPKNFTLDWENWHFSLFNFRPEFLIAASTFFKFLSWSFWSEPNIKMSSIYTRHPEIPFNILSMHFWKISGAVLMPKGIRLKQYVPIGLENVSNDCDLSDIGICR